MAARKPERERARAERNARLMAGPKLNRKHSEQVVERIQLAQIVNRLQDFGLGKLDPKTKQPIIMSDTQARVLLGLLHKRLANAEAPRDLRVKGELTLRHLVRAAVTGEKPEVGDDEE